MSVQAPSLQLPLTQPYLGPEEEAAVLEVLRSGWLVQGPRVAEFERQVAQYVGATHAVATSSCTTALHLALTLLGIGPGDEVLLPSFTFIASANAVRHAGATPVFVDIAAHSYTLDPACLEEALTERSRAIMPVHQLGLAADLDPIAALARRHDLLLLEDAAPALGALYKGQPIGASGNVTCFSFHPRKVITTGEGGLIVTNDETLTDRARVLRAHGMSVSDLTRHQASAVVFESYPHVGFNYRMTDLQAAVGLEQLKKLPFVLGRRVHLARRYADGFSGIDCIQLPFSSRATPHTYQSYMIELLPNAPTSRDELMPKLLDVGIPTRRGVMAIHLEPAYRPSCPVLSLPITERAAGSTLLLPLYTAMTDSQQDYVIEHVRRSLTT